MSTPGPVTKHWLGFSYICSEEYELYLNFNKIDMRSKTEKPSNNKFKSFCNNIVVV